MKDTLAAQVSLLRRSVHSDWRSWVGPLEVLNVAAPLRFAVEVLALKLCFRDKSWVWVKQHCAEITPKVWCGGSYATHVNVLDVLSLESFHLQF